MNVGFPELTTSFLAGQDILYTQFNDVDFYVEDAEQEHFYFNIFKKIFPEIKFEKIFPLGGKKNVKDAAKLTVGNKKKVYIVDLDFDDILGLKENAANLFYLEKYSIENHLISKSALFELVREKTPKLKNHEIEVSLNYNRLLHECKNSLCDLASSFILIQKYSLGIEFHGLNTSRDIDFSTKWPKYKNNFIKQFFDSIEGALKLINKRFTLKGQINHLKPNFKAVQDALSIIPGKYLLNVIKSRLESLSLISQVTLESFTYKLSKDIDTTEIDYLRVSVLNYI